MEHFVILNAYILTKRFLTLKIVMPVNGLIHLYKNEKRVLIKPQKDSENDGLEIIIENIDGYAHYENKSVKAGTPIGKATKARSCVTGRHGDEVRMHNLI